MNLDQLQSSRLSLILMAKLFMKENGIENIMLLMEEASKYGPMAQDMKDFGIKDTSMDMEG